MIIITLGIIFQLFVFIGLGLLLPGSPVRRHLSLTNLLLCFFSGWGAAVAFLQIWHLFFKVNAIPLLCLLSAAGAGWYLFRRDFIPLLRSFSLKTTIWLLGLAALPALVLANHILFNEPSVDLGLYHMQTIKWFQEFAIVPGLGNLHHRLAFNNASLLVAAVFDTDFLNLSSFYLINTTIVYATILLCGTALINLFRRAVKPNLSDYFYAFMLPVILWQSSTGYLAGYSPDFLIFSLEIVLIGELIRLFTNHMDPAEFKATGTFLIGLVAFGLTVKLSFAIFGVFVIAAILIRGATRYGLLHRDQVRIGLGWAGLLAVWLLPWLVRGVIFSGYPLFPSTIMALPFSWTMPEYLADPVQGVITRWARTRSNTIEFTGDWTWFSAWFSKFVYEAKWALLLSFAVLAANIVLALIFGKNLKNRNNRNGGAGLIAASGISFAAILYWFIMAPDYRFSGAVIWIFLICQILLGLSLLWRVGLLPRFASGVVILIFLFSLWLSPYQYSRNFSPARLIMPPSVEQAISRYRGDQTIHQQVTDSGLSVNLPAEGEGCWDAPLPCAPIKDFNARLGLIEPGNLQKGFYMQK